MVRSVAVIGAPSALGIRPYDDGRVRRLDLTPQVLRERGVVARLSAADLGDVVPPARYSDLVVHFDVDVLDPGAMPAVDSPIAGGLELEEAAALLGPVVRHPAALGLQVTIYDSTLDPDGAAAACLVDLLVRSLTGGGDR